MEFCLVCGIPKRGDDVHGRAVCTVLFDAGPRYQVWQYNSITNHWAAVSALMAKSTPKGDSNVNGERKARLRIDDSGREKPDRKAGRKGGPKEGDRPQVDERGDGGTRGGEEGRVHESRRARESLAEFLRLGLDTMKVIEDLGYEFMEGEDE